LQENLDMAFNRWSPYNYGSSNLKGWRLTPFDPNDFRIFHRMRTPASKTEWIEAIEYASKLWIKDKENLSTYAGDIPEDTYLYQSVIYVAAYYVAFKEYRPNVAYAYRSLIEYLLIDMSPESIFENDLNEWSRRKMITMANIYTKPRSLSALSNPEHGLLCSRCFLVFHPNRLASSQSQDIICADCA